MCIDKVANTTSVYGAYLKSFKKSAEKNLILKPIHEKKNVNVSENVVYNDYAENVVKKGFFDIVYLDPPYNQRQYSSNYSPLNYIAYYNPTLELKGKTGLIANYNKSDFSAKSKVKFAFKNMLTNLQCSYLLLSYNDEGLLTKEELLEFLIEKGDVYLYKVKYPKYKSQKKKAKAAKDVKDVKVNVYEYLWFVKVTDCEHKIYDEIEVELITVQTQSL